MRRYMIHLYRISALSFLTGSLLLSGCIQKNSQPFSTTAAPFTDTVSKNYEHYDEQQLISQKEFDQLTEELFLDDIRESQLELHCFLKDPTSYGIQKADHLFSPYTQEAFRNSRENRIDLENRLSSFDPGLLTPEQRKTLRILQSFLQTEKLGDGLELYSQPLAVKIGVQAQLPILLSEYTFYNQQDVDQYLELLENIDEYYAELMNFEYEKSKAGLMPSDREISHIIESCESYLLPPEQNFMTDTFEERLSTVEGLSAEDRTMYLEKNQFLIANDFTNAYQLLIDGLTSLKGTGVNDDGMCHYPDGKKFYEYLVRSATGTSFHSMEDLVKNMEDTMNQSIKKTSLLLRDHPNLLNEADNYQFQLNQPTEILEELKKLSSKDYPSLPECNYTIHDVPKSLEETLSPAFYILSPIDDYQNHVIYINRNPRFPFNSLFTTIAHEGYPGHMYQTAYFHNHCDSNIRFILGFPGYSEGWATYIEHNAYQMTEDFSQELGELLASNEMSTLGISACLDIYINYMGWNRSQVKEYLKKFNTDSDPVVDAIYTALVENPSNYLSYYVGCMEIMNMKAAGQQKLGPNFDLKEFHKFILDFGPAPFDVIQPYFTTWLNDQ